MGIKISNWNRKMIIPVLKITKKCLYRIAKICFRQQKYIKKKEGNLEVN